MPQPQINTSVTLSLPGPGHPEVVANRYRIIQKVHTRGDVERFVALDIRSISNGPTPVMLLREPINKSGAVWPSLAWEVEIRKRCTSLGIPRIVDRLQEAEYEYFVVESPFGVGLWDAWDDPKATDAGRYNWLMHLASLMQVLHEAGIVFESLRPDELILSPLGQLLLTDTAHLLPIPLPADLALDPSPTTPPELLSNEWTDARSDLYCFGAVFYALLVGRELTELDFLAPGVPKPFLQRFPDAQPLLGRLLSKTFCRDLERRFPTPDYALNDPTGFAELSHVIEQCQRTFGHVRLEVAAWTTTGITRTSNEDAYAILQGAEAGQDDLHEYVLVLLADGMGGGAAGEVAAALTVRSIRKSLLEQPPLNALMNDPDIAPEAVPPEELCERVRLAIREANRHVYMAAMEQPDRRGMGCTAEVVCSDGRNIIIGHVGDSRIYRLHRGELVCLTDDHTVVQGMVAAGHITPEQAEIHPRRSELRQAIGGRADVDPQMVRLSWEAGDCLLVCSDGLTTQLSLEAIRYALQQAPSAELAARRLVNLSNLEGAIDNTTVVVIKCL